MYTNLISTALGAALLFAIYIFQRQRQIQVAIRQHGCGDPIKVQPKEPFTGLDFMMGMHLEIPFLHRVFRKHGPTVQLRTLLGPPSIASIAPENIKAICSSREWGVQNLRLPFWEDFCGKGLLSCDGDMWHQTKKIWKPTFARENLFDLEYFAAQIDTMVKDIPGDGSTVDMQPRLYAAFLNTATMFLLGVDLSKDSDGAPYAPLEFITAFHDCMAYTMLRMILGRFWVLYPKKGYRKACKVAHEYADYYIDQELSGKGEATKTSSLLTMLSKQSDDRAYIRSQVLQGMMASQETTSSLIANACLCLSRNPKYWELLRSIAREPQNADLTFEILAGLQPVRNIVLEALRICPVFPTMGREALRDTTIPVGGGPNQDQPIYTPKGTTVTMSWYALHRNRDVFGDDADSFRPERWETITPGLYEWMGFGGGNRSCMGQPKVLAEATFVLMKLAKKFEMIESRDDRPWVGESKLTCKNKNGCQVAFFE